MDDPTQRYKIFNIDNEGMSEMFTHLFINARMANRDVNAHQNSIKRAAFELYEKFKADYKRLNRPKAHWGRISEMDLEEEAHNYALNKTFLLLSEFAELEGPVLDRLMTIISESPKNFFNALTEVLGKEK